MRRTTQRFASRRGFTLLEVLLASLIAVFIMYGVYTAIDLHQRYSDMSRRSVEDGTLGRSIMARVNADITSCVGLPDPGRYRNNNSGSSSSSTSSSPTTSSSSSSSSSTPSTSSDGTTSSDTMTEPQDNAELIRAFTGKSNYVQVYVSRVAGGQWSMGQNTSSTATANVLADQRLIVYWLAEGGGLCRQEITSVTGNADTQPIAMGSGDESRYVIAREVLSLEFSYFDGQSWTDTWDGRTLGSDNKTPQGPPVAVAVEITVKSAYPDREDKPLKFRQVVFIPASNGPQQPTEDMPSDSGTGTMIP